MNVMSCVDGATLDFERFLSLSQSLMMVAVVVLMLLSI